MGETVSGYIDGRNRDLLCEGCVLYRWFWVGKDKR
jgi:hypothetical protein